MVGRLTRVFGPTRDTPTPFVSTTGGVACLRRLVDRRCLGVSALPPLLDTSTPAGMGYGRGCRFHTNTGIPADRVGSVVCCTMGAVGPVGSRHRLQAAGRREPRHPIRWMPGEAGSAAAGHTPRPMPTPGHTPPPKAGGTGARHRTGSTTLRQQWRQRPPIAAGWCGGQPRSVGRCARDRVSADRLLLPPPAEPKRVECAPAAPRLRFGADTGSPAAQRGVGRPSPWSGPAMPIP